MCERYDLHSAPRSLKARFGLTWAAEYRPSYNIAPAQPVAAVTNHENDRCLELYRWGLIPGWATQTEGNDSFNAWTDRLDSAPVFRGPFSRQRCLVPADGYYQWQRSTRQDIPWYIHAADRQTMAFAGLFDVWTSPEGFDLRSVAIIVTAAAPRIATIHDSMPVILSPEDWDTWLISDTPKDALLALLHAATDEHLDMYPVSTWVNDPSHCDVRCIVQGPR